MTKTDATVAPEAAIETAAGLSQPTNGVGMSREEMYREGSECCRNYSKLTMQVRTHVGLLMLGYAVGIGTMGSNWLSHSVAPTGPGLINLLHSLPRQAGLVLLFGGVALFLFAVSLWTVNWHFSTAFRAMRDVICELEPAKPIRGCSCSDGGPWRAHKRAREPLADTIAWNLPFGVLAVIAAVSVVAGLVVV